MAQNRGSLKQINWLGVVLLAVSGATIYMMPYARSTYYDPMMKAFNITNTQLGSITSMFGFLTLVCYFPGGWLADKFSAKKLLFVSFAANAILGFWYSRLPSYGTILFIHVLLGIFCTVTFWAAYIKGTRLCAPPECQARAFGFVEGFRRIASTVIALVGAYLIKLHADSPADAVQSVLVFYSLMNAGVAVAILLFLPNVDTSGEGKTGASVADILRVARIPEIWFIAAIVMLAYLSYRVQDIMTPYSTNLCGLSAALGATLAAIRHYGMGFFAIGGGFLGDRIGSANTLILGFFVIIVTNVLLLLFPGTPATLGLFVFILMTFMVAHFAMRGVYYALLNEGQVPVGATGIATGIIATIAYSPDFYAPLYQGKLLDIYGKDVHTGYNYIFMTSIGACILGIVLCHLFKKRVAAKIAAQNTSPTPASVAAQA